jgi:U2 small nuclear ribonucleoprotein A'
MACVPIEVTSSSRFPAYTRKGVYWISFWKLLLIAIHSFKERVYAQSLFITGDKLPTALATSLSSSVSSHRVTAPAAIDEPRTSTATSGKAGRLMTDEERAKVKLAIAQAKSAEEVRKLEQQLQEGWIPK